MTTPELPESLWVTEEPYTSIFKEEGNLHVRTDYGFPVLLMRNSHSGTWCGYVAVSPDHPAHGKKYNSIDVEVHGGLTYGRFDPWRDSFVGAAEESKLYWLGFDCNHLYDMNFYGVTFSDFGDHRTYRTFSYALEETRNLARQLDAVRGNAE